MELASMLRMIDSLELEYQIEEWLRELMKGQ